MERTAGLVRLHDRADLTDGPRSAPAPAHRPPREAFSATDPDAPDGALLNLADEGRDGWWERHGDTWQPVDVRIAIQPATLGGGVEPYPYFVDEVGMIGRQDHWKGSPAQLAGFQADPTVQNVDLEFDDFAADPHQAVGMHPIFIDADGSMWTLTNPIDSVTVRVK